MKMGPACSGSLLLIIMILGSVFTLNGRSLQLTKSLFMYLRVKMKTIILIMMRRTKKKMKVLFIPASVCLV